MNTHESRRHLELTIVDSLSTLVRLSSFKLLRTLKIRLSKWIFPTKEPPIFLHLSHLDQLFILGNYSALRHAVLHLPSLDLLIIQVDDV